MKSVPKLIRRFAIILVISSLLILFLNAAALILIGRTQTASGSPYNTAKRTAQLLKMTEGGYSLDAEYLEKLEQDDIWAILIDDATHQVVWNTANLPDNIPRKYSLADISALTLGYVKDYPTFTGQSENGLLVLGYPKTRYWKMMWPTWDYDFIASLPRNFLLVLAANLILIFLIYVYANSKLLKSFRPIMNGIQALSLGESVYMKEKGLLSEVSACINRTSEVLQDQKYQLQKKETARANWIAGVSHDIRTPLSMVMGYADQLLNDIQLTDEQHKMAKVILKQSERIRNLINDLNLASKLEYNMQPVNVRQENAVALVRQVIVDFINTDIEDKYPIEWITDENLSVCFVNADKNLLKRAISNLIQNCINHNEEGCSIYVSVEHIPSENAHVMNLIDRNSSGKTKQDCCVIRVEDSGVGTSDELIEELNTTPHYMVCDTDTTGQRHGLGLLIVKQIAISHNGIINIGHSRFGGFSVEIILPI